MEKILALPRELLWKKYDLEEALTRYFEHRLDDEPYLEIHDLLNLQPTKVDEEGKVTGTGDDRVDQINKALAAKNKDLAAKLYKQGKKGTNG